MREIESAFPENSLQFLIEEIANEYIDEVLEDEINDVLAYGMEITIFNCKKEMIRNYFVNTYIKYCFDVVSI